MKKLIIALVVVLFIFWSFSSISILRTTIPGKIIRWCLGEPGATQQVNDAADKIISSNWNSELEKLCDKLINEYKPLTSKLKHEPFSDGYLIPLERIPIKFYKLGPHNEPDVVIRIDEHPEPSSLVFSWGHMRHAIFVFTKKPLVEPKGFHSRKVSDRVYVVANES